MNILRLPLLLSLVPSSASLPLERVQGVWNGRYECQSGEAGDDRLILLETSHGTLYGDWQGLIVTGRRLDNGELVLRGRDERSSHYATGRLEQGQLRLTWRRLSLENSHLETGTSSLQRDVLETA